nr:MAG TPA: hypothetical protein [Bacteriophage sp.]
MYVWSGYCSRVRRWRLCECQSEGSGFESFSCLLWKN